MLARGRLWRAELLRANDAAALTIERDGLPRELEELADFRVEVPLREWRRLLSVLRGGRKLLGGLLLDFACQKERLSAVIANDRLLRARREPRAGDPRTARVRRPAARVGGAGR